MDRELEDVGSCLSSIKYFLRRYETAYGAVAPVELYEKQHMVEKALASLERYKAKIEKVVKA